MGRTCTPELVHSKRQQLMRSARSFGAIATVVLVLTAGCMATLTSSTATPTVHSSPVYSVNVTTGVVYGQGLYCTGPEAANFSQKGCVPVNLTLSLLRPMYNDTTKVPLPSGPMPVFLGIHGGSYSHGGATDEYDNVEFFAQRGWLGLSINYRLCNGGYGGSAAVRPNGVTDGGNLVCEKYGSFPSLPPYGNTSCGDPGVKTFGIGTHDGCALSSPPKTCSFFGTLMSWMYPSVRDAKAAVRWVRANADQLGVDTEYITAIGGSAGACSVVGLATTFEDDYKTEISPTEDPTLASTNLEETSDIATGLVQWGGDFVPIYTQLRDPQNATRYTKAAAPLATFHGSDDGVICPAQEDTIKAGYARVGVTYEQHILKGWGHGADAAPVTLPNGTNVTQHSVMFEFVTRMQKLSVTP